MPPEETPAAAWLRQEILPHEGMVRAWLRTRFPGEREADDVLQEAYLRIQRAREAGEIHAPKAFFFATVRNLVVGEIRKNHRRQVFSLADWEGLDVMDEGADVNAAVSRSEELEWLTRAIQSLPTRCRQIITLRKIYGMSQKDIAEELGISVNTVETQATIGMHKIQHFLEQADKRRFQPDRHG